MLSSKADFEINLEVDLVLDVNFMLSSKEDFAIKLEIILFQSANFLMLADY
jgi:hypothetical protein